MRPVGHGAFTGQTDNIDAACFEHFDGLGPSSAVKVFLERSASVSKRLS